MALDENSAGILLDDPVSSLDFDWKEIMALQVVDEAKRQQAIVFTHDLHFLHLLKKIAEEEKVTLRSHWIQKRDNIPGWVYLDNSPITEKEYRKSTKAKEYLDRAKQAGLRDANEEQVFLGAGFGALRTTYEVFVMRELFAEVVTRFEERVSGDRLKNVYIDVGIRDEVIENIGRLSRYIDAHSHSDAYAAQKPTCAMLDDEIKLFNVLQERNGLIKEGTWNKKLRNLLIDRETLRFFLRKITSKAQLFLLFFSIGESAILWHEVRHHVLDADEGLGGWQIHAIGAAYRPVI